MVNKKPARDRAGCIQRLMRAFRSVTRKRQPRGTTGQNLSDAPRISESTLDDEQIENSLIRTIWEHTIELPESIAVSRKVINEPFSLSVLLSNIDTLYTAIAVEKGLTFTLDLGNEINGFFIGDQAKIGRILRNLVNNAIIHTDQGIINVTCIFRNQLLIVSISDTGGGIPKEEIRSLTYPMDEVDAAIENDVQDKGLFMTKALCDLLGGDLSVKSERQIGSVVTVSIPLHQTASEPDESMPGLKLRRNWQKKYGDIPGLDQVFLRGLVYMRWEIEELERLLESDKRHEISGMLHSMKGFPGGFGLTVIHDKIRMIEQLVHQERYDRDQVAKRLDDLKQFLASIPDQPFPEASVTASVGKETDNELTSQARSHQSVLVADDDPMNSEMIEYILKKLGPAYRLVKNGEEVLQQLGESSFDLLLLDIRMPVMGGIETINRIRKDYRFDNLTIIAMTANDLSGKEAEFERLGCDDFISKPIDLDLLTSKIQTALDCSD